MKINIDDSLIEKIKERVKDSDEFNSAEDYIDHILRQVVKRLSEEKKSPYSEVDEKKVKERLKALGYLD